MIEHGTNCVVLPLEKRTQTRKSIDWQEIFAITTKSSRSPTPHVLHSVILVIVKRNVRSRQAH
jgi:hypothetical protein